MIRNHITNLEPGSITIQTRGKGAAGQPQPQQAPQQPQALPPQQMLPPQLALGQQPQPMQVDQNLRKSREGPADILRKLTMAQLFL